MLFSQACGRPPLHLAGREREKTVLIHTLQHLQSRTPPSHNISLRGPRGFGKTSLLAYAAELAKAMNAEKGADCVVRTLKLSAGDIGAPAQLYAATLRRQPPVSYEEIKSWSWREQLVQECMEEPLLLMIDEAHTLDIKVASLLLHGSQDIRGCGGPFALLLAGTPHLHAHLARTKAGFWPMLADGNLRLGLLSLEESMEALRLPFEASSMGFECDADAIERMARMSEGYPCFVQLWGSEAELYARSKGLQVDMGAVDAIQGGVQDLRNELYEDRWRELDEAGLLDGLKRLARTSRAARA